MLILAGVSLNAIIGDNGIITNAQRAAVMSRFSTYKEELGMNALEDTGVYASGDKMKQYIPSMEDQDIDKFVIMKSELLYIATDEMETSVAQNLGLGGISGETSDSGAAIKEIQNIISGVVELKEDFSDKVPADDSQLLDEPEHTNNEDGLIGTRLFDRNALNMASHTWNILDEYNSKNEKTARYGSGYYWLKKGVTYTIDGEAIEFKNDYVVDYAKNEYIVLSGRAVNWNENSTLAVTDGLVLNVDPMSLADGEWVNSNSTVYDATKTYENELALANAITDEETRTAELNKVRNENFYNFWVQNPITEEWTNTGTQKTGDLAYNLIDKSLDFNKDESNNTEGVGGFLRIANGTNSFANGFTFEIYFNPTRLFHTHEGWDPADSREISCLGLFCSMPETYFKSTAEAHWENYINRVMRFCYCNYSNNLTRFLGDYSNFYDGETFTTSSIFSYNDGGDLYYYVSRNKNEELFNAGENFYYTVVYERSVLENDDDYEFMRENNADRISFYIDGKFLGRTFYPKTGFDMGRTYWDVADSYFQIGRCPINRPINMFYLKGKVYATRLYNEPLSSAQVKDNYDMTLKYRSSF